MSTAAIFDVTLGLQTLLRAEVRKVVPSAVVTLLPPGQTLPDTSGVNLYLYRVMESPYTKNRPWPGDRSTPPSDQSTLGLQLYYLLTPLGKKPDDNSLASDDAHRMLGVAMFTFHTYPILNDVHLADFDADSALPAYLRDSYEQIKVTLLPTSVEELSKIWATINQPYRLSVAYEVSLVELTPTIPPPVGGGIVMSTDVNVITLDAPRLSALTPPLGPLAQLSGGNVVANTLVITGFGFSFPGQTPVVTVGGQVVTIAAAPPPTDQSVTVTLPASLDAGPQVDVRVALNGRVSAPLVYTVSPWLGTITPIRTAFDTPPLTLVLAGSGFAATPAPQVRFDGNGIAPLQVPVDPGFTDVRSTVTVPAALSAANGTYNVRVVDAAGNLTNARTLEVIPLLASATPAGNQLTIVGQRLAGASVRLFVDGIAYEVTGATSTGFTYTFAAPLRAGTHAVSVSVDGASSHALSIAV